jgi:DNA gyrase/topoisomerase IV subunit A
MLGAFTDFREEVVGRRTKFLLKKARDRAHMSWSALPSPLPISTKSSR